MKRILCLIFATVVLFASCQTKRALLASDYYREEALLNDLTTAIEQRDSNALLDAFSQEAIEDAEDITAQIEQFFSDFPNGPVLWNDISSNSRSYDRDGENLIKIMASYELYIGEKTYTVFMIRWESDYRVTDEKALKKIGIYTLRIVEEKDYSEQYEQLHYSRMEIPGVYYKPSRLYPD